MVRPISDNDLADLFEALGQVGRARDLRETARLDPDEQTRDELVDSICEIVNQVPEMKSGKHDAECWKRHASCLADKIYEII